MVVFQKLLVTITIKLILSSYRYIKFNQNKLASQTPIDLFHFLNSIVLLSKFKKYLPLGRFSIETDCPKPFLISLFVESIIW